MNYDLPERNVEKIHQIVSGSNFKDLTLETLLMAYKEEGIQSLEDLAKRLIEALQDPKRRPQRPNYEGLFSEPTPDELLEKIEHKVPKVPFILNGVTYDPEDIVEFNGQELCFIVDSQPIILDSRPIIVDSRPNIVDSRQKQFDLHVLADKGIWASILGTVALGNLVEGYKYGGYHTNSPLKPLGPQFPPLPEPEPAPGRGGLFSQGSLPASVTVYNRAEREGYSLQLGPREEYIDLTSTYIFWPVDTWNDEISSIGGTSSTCVYFEHVRRWGSALTLNGENVIGHRNLSDIGWNDRISSFVNFG